MQSHMCVIAKGTYLEVDMERVYCTSFGNLVAETEPKAAKREDSD